MDGIERIKILSQEIVDEPLLKIVEYLLTRNDMNDKYLNEEKSLKQMISFIKSQAKMKAVDGVAMIADEIVFGLAIHYWDESNDNLKITKEIKTKVRTPVPKKKKKQEKSWIPEGQLALFD